MESMDEFMRRMSGDKPRMTLGDALKRIEELSKDGTHSWPDLFPGVAPVTFSESDIEFLKSVGIAPN